MKLEDLRLKSNPYALKTVEENIKNFQTGRKLIKKCCIALFLVIPTIFAVVSFFGTKSILAGVWLTMLSLVFFVFLVVNVFSVLYDVITHKGNKSVVTNRFSKFTIAKITKLGEYLRRKELVYNRLRGSIDDDNAKVS